MPLLDNLALWLQHYDTTIKVITALAASGGIWFWIDKYRNRIRIKVRSLNLPTGDTSLRAITFEAENISASLTSLEPTLTLTGYALKRGKQTYTFRIQGDDRQLPPHVTKQVVGFHNHPENRIMLFLWYMIFTLSLTKGSSVHLRYRNAEFERLSFLRFHWERLQYIFFGKVPGK